MQEIGEEEVSQILGVSIPLSMQLKAENNMEGDQTINVNTFTHPILSNPLYFCNSCRDFLKRKKVTPKDSNDIFFCCKMCVDCRDFNLRIRSLYTSFQFGKQ